MDFEKLGAFYLGRPYDPDSDTVLEEPLLYDSRHLRTHAVCLGMTGSGKTGLCLGLLEEAAIDSIPAIAIDPKGDLSNLLLTFPELRPEDFAPWIEPGEARRKGRTEAEHAQKIAETWRNGLAQWGQTPDRIAKMRETVEIALYTPGASGPRPLSVLGSLSAPAGADAEVLRDKVLGTVTGLLTLLDIDGDPLQSREHILLARIIEATWADGRSLDLPELVRLVSAPPFDRVGVLDLESFFPQKDRTKLSMALNNLLASPGFEDWTKGEPLDIQRLLWTEEGKPRLTVLSIAHLTDAERMFFVTTLFSEVLAWMRTQPGTSALRALLYMDEVAGYVPPVKAPPSKAPLLTLLKQARAFGLGVVLATQNPMDLDYKGLSNIGTWFLGKLQTERDRARVLDGLTGAGMDKSQVEALLDAVKSRVFLLHDVKEDHPVLFHTRWALSWLRGPLTRAQLKDFPEAQPPAGASAAHAVHRGLSAASRRPVAPTGVEEGFAVQALAMPRGARLEYRPNLLATVRVHYAHKTYGVDSFQELVVLSPLEEGEQVWDPVEVLDEEDVPELEERPEDEASFATLPSSGSNPHKRWSRELATWVYREQALRILRCKTLKLQAEPDETEGDFRARLAVSAREARGEAMDTLQGRFVKKLAAAEERLRKAHAKLEREQAQAKTASLDAAVKIGTTIFSSLFGGRSGYRSMGTAARGVTRAAAQRGDISAAEQDIAARRADIDRLNQELSAEAQELAAKWDPATLELDEVVLRPRKSDTEVLELTLVWTPWAVDSGGAEPLF